MNHQHDSDPHPANLNLLYIALLHYLEPAGAPSPPPPPPPPPPMLGIFLFAIWYLGGSTTIVIITFIIVITIINKAGYTAISRES